METQRTEAQQQASRTNGAKSQGPVTEDGKARSARNATRHGLYSKNLTGVNENEQDFQDIVAEYRAVWRPANTAEDDLVRRMASAQFRMDRLDAIETALFDQHLREHIDDSFRDFGNDVPMFQAIGFRASVDSSRALELAHKMMTSFDRMFHRNRNALEKMQKARTAKEAEEQPERTLPTRETDPPPASNEISRIEPSDYLHGMTWKETAELLRRDIYRPDTVPNANEDPPKAA